MVNNAAVNRRVHISLRINVFNQFFCVDAMEYYSAIEKDKILPFVTTWMDLEISC